MFTSPLTLDVVLSFLLTATLIELTPGPNMTYLAMVSASDGRRLGFVTVLGVALGLAVIGAIAALGIAQVIQASVVLYEILRWAGVLFLLYLAWDGWNASAHSELESGGTWVPYFMRGLITNLLNPKAAIFYVAVLPTFITPAAPIAAQAFTLTAIYVAVATAIHTAIVLLAGTLEPFLNDSRREQVARRILSALLAVVALWFAWSTAR
jgi:threonine/homoserine/homoserine lactone efflux protein